jgi:Immunity protein 39
MIAKPPHNRKLGLSGVSLTKARLNKQSGKALDDTRDEIEKIIIDSEYLEGAPFSWVTIAVRYGLKNDGKPCYQAVNKKYGDLPLSIEVDTHELIDTSLEELKLIFKEAVLKALIHAGKKFERPTGPLERVLESIPESAS